jgi:hypothetical protein
MKFVKMPTTNAITMETVITDQMAVRRRSLRAPSPRSNIIGGKAIPKSMSAKGQSMSAGAKALKKLNQM